MKNLSFAIISFLILFLTACGGNPEASQIDNQNPAMVAQQQVEMPVTASVDEAVVELDNTKTANQPTEKAAKAMEDKSVALDKSMKADIKKDTPKAKQQQDRPSATTVAKTVVSPTKTEKPVPMTTEVEDKVKVITNDAEQSTENTSVTPTTKTPIATPSRPVDNNSPQTAEVVVEVNTPDHTAWDKLLRTHVSSRGKVDYAGIKAQQSKLDAYLKELENNPPQADWSRNEKLAYWINVYNAYTVKLIVNNYPVKSITDLEGGKPWDKKWIKIDGKTYSLNNVENDIIRPRFKEPRIHFAVNCAAQSCPPLLNKAWTASNLSANFNQQAKAFINNDKFNKISANSVTVSKIFDWYGEDFGNLISYLNKFSNTKINPDAKVNYKEYDWSLNN